MPATFTGPVLADPPTRDLRRLLQLRRHHPLMAEVATADLADLWGCSQLRATAQLARFNRLRIAEVLNGSRPDAFYVLPILSIDDQQ